MSSVLIMATILRPECVYSAFSQANRLSINLCASTGFVTGSPLREPNLAKRADKLAIIISGSAL